MAKRIAVIDDDPAVAEVLEELLVEEGSLLRVIEREMLHLLGARGVVEATHEVVIGLGGMTEGDRAGNGAITLEGIAHA